VLAMLYNYLGYHARIVDVGIYLSLALTLLSGFHYIWHAAKALGEPAQS